MGFEERRFRFMPGGQILNDSQMGPKKILSRLMSFL
jgi:hypothetical protein